MADPVQEGPVQGDSNFAKAGWTAKDQRGSWWYECPVCTRHVPYEQTVTSRIYADFGRRVCVRCDDEPGTDELREQHAAIMRDVAAREADSGAKPP